MAKVGTSSSNWKATPKRRRPGVHSKKKNSVHKNGKNYQKKNVGQGRKR
jgi:hypothetical protein